ncbi:MAG TPA: hypothetical protein VFE24_05230 [Pirellulales bacterium]|jgi:hypothetical protein|nr:hypothetical protein [Pirellulales bacterium]
MLAILNLRFRHAVAFCLLACATSAAFAADLQTKPEAQKNATTKPNKLSAIYQGELVLKGIANNYVFATSQDNPVKDDNLLRLIYGSAAEAVFHAQFPAKGAFSQNDGKFVSPEQHLSIRVSPRFPRISPDGFENLDIMLEATALDDDTDHKVSVDDLKAANDKFAKALPGAVQKKLNEAIRADLAARHRSEARDAEAQAATLKEYQDEAAALQQDLNASDSVLPPNVLLENIATLQKQRQAFELELVGLKGRTAALQQAIAKSTERLDLKAADDKVVKNLQKVIELRTAQLERLMTAYKAASVSADAVDRAKDDLALSEVELARAQAAAVHSAGSDQIQSLQSDLIQTAVTAAEQESKFKFLDDQFNRTKQQYADALANQPRRERLAHYNTLIKETLDQQRAYKYRAKSADAQSSGEVTVELLPLSQR